MQVLRGVLRSPRVNELAPGREFWDAPQALKELRCGKYFGTDDAADKSTSAYPPALQVCCWRLPASHQPPPHMLCDTSCDRPHHEECPPARWLCLEEAASCRRESPRPFLQALLAEDSSRAPQALSALGGATFYLRQVHACQRTSAVCRRA